MSIALALLVLAAGALVIVEHVPASASAKSEVTGYAVLDDPPVTSPSSLDKPVTLDDVAVHVSGLDLDDARVLDDQPDESVILVPRADDELCVVRLYSNGSAGGTCETNDVADSRGIISGSLGHTSGVVPDGVDHVDFTLSDGGHSSTPVTHNMFTAPPEAVIATYLVSGQLQTVVMIPASRAPAGAIDVG
jgi:hypothetical protein